jgi:2-methylisocitrate lyase-like PEP mutase family enzyme
VSSGLAVRADLLRSLHHQDHPLVLANAWDAASARLVVSAGFRAIATSSGAMVESLGWSDGSTAPPDEVFGAIHRITRSVKVPVSADLEDGYRLAPSELVARLLSAGAVGCNLEDADHHSDAPLIAAEIHAEQVATIKREARDSGVDIVLNARTDVLLRSVGALNEQITEACRRAALYLEAGADCIFVPVLDASDDTLTQLVSQIDGPVNLLARPNVKDIGRLARAGAARISVGSGLFRSLNKELADLLSVLASESD